MKKLLSLFLAVIMMLGIATVGFASAEISGWSGDCSNASFEGRDAVKVDGSASLDTGMSFKGVVMLTADVYATSVGTISLEDASGNQAGVITLADGKINNSDVSYNTNAWNTLKLYALTGVKKYQVYLGNTFVCETNIEDVALPSKVSVSGSEVYIDNLKLTEMKKASQYAVSDLETAYRSDNFVTADVDRTLDGHEEWKLEYWGNISLVPNVTIQAAELNGERVARFKSVAGDEGDNGIPAVRLVRDMISDKKNTVIEGKFYYPSKNESDQDNTAHMKIYLNRYPDWSQIDLISLKDEGISYESLGGVVQKNAFPKDEWFTLRVEILYESQTYDVYVNDTKINTYPIGFEGITYGELPGFNQLDLQMIYDTENDTIVYMKDFKLCRLGEKVETTEVFSENFNSDTAKFTLTDGYVAEGMTANTGLVLTSNATTGKGDTGKGRLYNGQINLSETNYFFRVTEEAPVDTNNFALADYKDEDIAAVGSEDVIKTDARYHSNQLDLSGAQQVTVKFKFYDAAMLRRSSTENKAPREGMIVTLDKSLVNNGEQARNIARPALFFNWADEVCLFDKTPFAVNDMLTSLSSTEGSFNYHTNYGAGAKTWYDAELTITPGEELPYTLTVNGNTHSYAANGSFTTDDLAELKYLSFAITPVHGGCYYIDDVSVSKLTALGYLTINGLYEEAYKCYSEELVRNAVATVSVSDGKIDTISISYASEVSDNSKVFVAVYDGDALSKVAVFEKEAGGVYNAEEKALSVNEDSLIKVFCFAKNTLTPQGIFQMVKNSN